MIYLLFIWIVGALFSMGIIAHKPELKSEDILEWATIYVFTFIFWPHVLGNFIGYILSKET